MTQGKSHSVRRVVRLGWGFQIAQAPDHVHHLGFFRAAVAHHRLLDLKRRIFIDFHPRLLAGQQDHSPAVGHGNTRGDIGVEKQLLNGNGLRLEGLKKLRKIIIDLFQAACQAGMGRR